MAAVAMAMAMAMVGPARAQRAAGRRSQARGIPLLIHHRAAKLVIFPPA
jgi:hypothetical protein